LHAGPSAGKTATAHKLVGQLQSDGYNIDMVPEYVKSWAYADRKPQGMDQIYIFGKQIHQEDRMLRHIRFIVCEAPLYLMCAYCSLYSDRVAEHLIGMSRKFEQDFPGYHIVLDRTGIKYNTHGRWGGLEDAKLVDRTIEAILADNGVQYDKLFTVDFDKIIERTRAVLDADLASQRTGESVFSARRGA
jgi:hypothetical protein